MAVSCVTDEYGYTTCFQVPDEPVSKKVERLEAELKDAKAKLAAEAEKAKESVGQRLAHLISYATTVTTYPTPGGGNRVEVYNFRRDQLAAAIDKAIADRDHEWFVGIRAATGFDALVPNGPTPKEFARHAVGHATSAAKAEQRESDAELLDVASGFAYDSRLNRHVTAAEYAALIRANK